MRWCFWNRHEKFHFSTFRFSFFCPFTANPLACGIQKTVKWGAGIAVSGSLRPALYARTGIPSKSSKEVSEQKTQRPLTEYSTHLWLIHTERHSHSKNLTSPDSAHTAANVTASNIHISLSAERMEDLDESEQEKERNFQRAALKSLSRTASELIERTCVTGNN